MAGFARDEEIELFEEIKFEPQVMCELVDKKTTFSANQKIPKVGSVEQFRYPDIPSFLEYVHRGQEASRPRPPFRCRV
ncbi:ubiquitin carboxyl-terminal hydrolase 13 [Stylosanthes scabra]|uniref:Ubiquitin carboxyl-terminal hydrolase 13 n=1 Tax=Stylosanthes scabra TaxID=79078 RepID=A0ABU6SFM1_9FABA|nr:ubiquitin carboxyl-terminal hydrolase 13 [Stylosanthes scabra]